MRLAFVLRLGNDTRPDEGLYEGWVEEVDSGKEIRFRSAEELLGFLGQRFLAIARLNGKKPERNGGKPGSSSEKG